MNQQTVIPVAAVNELTLNNFFQRENAALIDALIAVSIGARAISTLFFWGRSGSGKTHLLNACCEVAAAQNRAYRYLSLEQDSLDALPSKPLPAGALLCLDNIERLQHGGVNQTVSLLSVYEQVIAHGGNLIAAATVPLQQLNIPLPDLVSRLSCGGTFHLEPLSDDAKPEALRQRARQRGFALNAQVMDFIMNHYDRDTGALFALLDRIDRLSLAQKRKITVPFVRGLIASRQTTSPLKT